MIARCLFLLMLLSAAVVPAADDAVYDHRVLATNKTSTMEKEMNEAADEGYAFAGVMGGVTDFGGHELVIIMSKGPLPAEKAAYRLLATRKTSTMQEELLQAGQDGFEYCGQTVYSSAFGGAETVVILERKADSPPDRRIEYRLLATTKTSTMQKELSEAGEAGFKILGMSVGSTSFGGNEVVAILGRSSAE